MREIKFRFYIPDNGQMAHYSLEDIMQGGWYDHPKDFKVMQFTGLLDKNGKEIYEGDIVKNEFGSIDEVEFEQGYDGDDRGRFYWSGVCLMGDPNKWEVIGNIWENPDLIKNNN